MNEIEALDIPSPFIEPNSDSMEKLQADALSKKVHIPVRKSLFHLNVSYIFKQFEIDIADLKRFIIQNEGEYLLKKYSETGSLSDPYRKTLVTLIVKKLTNEHSYWPSTDQKIKFAKLAVEIFPIYKTESDNSYVSMLSRILLAQFIIKIENFIDLYPITSSFNLFHTQELFFDPVKQKGFINSRLKTVQKNIRETTGERKQTKKRSASTPDESNKQPRLSEAIEVEALKIQFKDDIEFLKNCPSTEVSAIHDRMKRTFSLRRALIHSKQIADLCATFPCYLTTPNDVSFSPLQI